MLSDIYLASVDRKLEASVSQLGVLRIVRYVDDYLLIVSANNNVNFDQKVSDIIDMFYGASDGLKFTYEKPVNDTLQFLE